MLKPIVFAGIFLLSKLLRQAEFLSFSMYFGSLAYCERSEYRYYIFLDNLPSIARGSSPQKNLSIQESV